MPIFSLRLLGAPALDGPAGPVSGRAAHRRPLAVLAVLAAARGRPVSRERLLGLLWAEQPAEAGRRSLTEAVYVLRKELGADALRSVGDEVALEPAAVAADVQAFETALEAGDDEAAARLWGGPFLDGFYVEGAADFERWAEGERERLAHACAAALERLANAAAREGSAVRAVEWWRRLATHQPHSSRAALGLARALDAAGDPAAALRVAQVHAVRMREELDVPPDPAVTAFAESLRARPAPAPPALASPAAIPPPAPEAVPAAAAGTSTAPLAEAAPSSASPAHPPPAGPPAPIQIEGAPGRTDGVPSRTGEVPGHIGDAPIRIGDAPGRTGDAPASGGRRRDRLRRWALRSAAAVGVPLAIVLAGTALLRPHPSAPAAVPGPDPRRVAVLYFDDLSPRRDLGYFADGLTEMLISGLTGVEELEVISTHGVRPFRGAGVALDSVAAALGVGTIVEGSVRRVGEGQVRVAVRVVDAGTRAPLGGRVVVRPLGEVARLEDELAGETAELLRRRVGRTLRMRANEEGTRSGPARMAALQAMPLLEDARALERTRDSADAGRAVRLLLRADGLLDEAQRQDPGWTEPAVRRGWVAHALARMGPPGDAAGWRARGLAHAERALRRSPGNARALELRGALRWLGAVQNEGDAGALEAAEADLRAAAAAEPGLASAWVRLSQLLRYGGRFAEAELAARRALEADAWLDEAVGGVQQLFGAALAREDYAQARALCDDGRLRRPADWWFTECALTLLREERAAAAPADSAWRLVAALERLDPPAVARAAGRGYSPLYRRMVAAALSARAGGAARARAEAERARGEAAGDAGLRLSLRYDDAYLRLALGDTAGARAELDAYAAARPALREYLARDPLFRGVWPTRRARSGR